MKSLLVLFACCLVARLPAQLVQLPTDYGMGREGDGSTSFPDQPTLSVYGFDDFTTNQDYVIDQIVAYGIEFGHFGTVHARITQNANHTAPGILFLDVSQAEGEVNGDWTIEFSPISLAAGNYWLEVWVDMNFTWEFGWQWANSNTKGTSGVRGNESRLHNPGGGFGFGTNPIPASQTGLHGPRDNAFRINVVAEPETLFTLALAFATFLFGRAMKTWHPSYNQLVVQFVEQ